MSAMAVEARGLRKSYDGVTAVDGIDFAVAEGECLGFLGTNGAGKTTTMKMVYGLAAIDGGELLVLGRDMRRARRRVKARLGVVPQDDNLDADLTVRENLLVQCCYHGIRGRAASVRANELLDLAGLADRHRAFPRELSGGMRRRLLVVRALAARPALVVLDEPTNGLDPGARLVVWETLAQLRAEGVTLLLTTHYMDEAARLCDRLVVIHRGAIADEGSSGELVERHGQPDLEAVFLHLTGHGLDA
jgi:lipooligosaccharide transport system ATP-binding protein